MDKADLILKCAIKVFAEKGYHDTKVQMIADEAGIGVGTIYRYFKNKEEILNSIFICETKKGLQFLEEIKHNNKAPLENLKALLEFHFDRYRENPGYAWVVVQELFPLIHTNSEIREQLQNIKDQTMLLLENAQKIGEVRSFDIDILYTVVLQSLRGIVFAKQFSGSDKEYDMLKNEAITFILNGIK